MLYSMAESSDAFEAFARDAIAIIEGDQTTREVLLRNETARDAAIERWLVSFGDRADPSILAAMERQKPASDVLAVCFRLRARLTS